MIWFDGMLHVSVNKLGEVKKVKSVVDALCNVIANDFATLIDQ